MTGEEVHVLRGTGSGGDAGSMKHHGIPLLHQEELLALEAHNTGLKSTIRWSAVDLVDTELG